MTSEELYFFFFETFGSCGCGDPDAVAQLLLDVLTRVEAKVGRAGLVDLLPTDGTMFSYLGWLNHIELLEHGAGMPGWMTDKGKAVLAALREFGVNVDLWRE